MDLKSLSAKKIIETLPKECINQLFSQYISNVPWVKYIGRAFDDISELSILEYYSSFVERYMDEHDRNLPTDLEIIYNHNRQIPGRECEMSLMKEFMEEFPQFVFKIEKPNRLGLSGNQKYWYFTMDGKFYKISTWSNNDIISNDKLISFLKKWNMSVEICISFY